MLPTRVQKNQPITADLLNNIIDSIRECQLQSGAGYSFSRSGGGTTLSISIPKAGQPVAQCPFDVSGSISGGNLLLTVRAGTLNGLYATNFVDCLSVETTNLSTSTAGSTNVILDVTTDGKQVTAYTINTENSVTPASPTTPLAPTSFKWPIAHIKDGVIYKTIACGSLSAVVRENTRIAKAPTTPDDNAFDIYYYWKVES